MNSKPNLAHFKILVLRKSQEKKGLNILHDILNTMEIQSIFNASRFIQTHWQVLFNSFTGV